MLYESWIDRQIREAQERGAFDNLPGAGRPLHLDDDPDWWIKAKIKRENLEPALPGPVLLRREVENIQDALVDVADEATARAIVEALNDRIRGYYAQPTTGPFIAVRLVDVQVELARWRQRRSR